MIIEYWSDFACPFCYIAETRMKKALRELDISDECRLDFKAFELNQDAPRYLSATSSKDSPTTTA